MGQPKKKGRCGAATNYVSRARALKKLQLSLKDFRRLCILKGIYPHEPKRKMVAGRKNSSIKTYYYLKDIQFLAHEPIINSFRKLKVFMRKVKKATGRKDKAEVARLYENRPRYKLDHVVKERYPTFLDALRDLDDTLSMCMLFATLPKSHFVPTQLTHICRRLTSEFLNYVIESHSLRKVFISIKGYYYQAEIQGQVITWIVPHQFSYKSPNEVDFKIMVTFVEFYSTMLGFVNFKLYNHLNLHYPPILSSVLSIEDGKDYAFAEELAAERAGALNQTLARVIVPGVVEEGDVDEFPQTDDPEKLKEIKDNQAKINRLQKLFAGFKFYLSREVPREPFAFVIRCCGGEVSWDKTINIGATFSEDDSCVTHHVVDRPTVPMKIVNKYYIQPQYIFDCVNNCTLVPVEKYFPGVVLPPHLSPFVEESVGDYIPPDKLTLLQRPSDADTGICDDEPESEEVTESENEEENKSEVEVESKGKVSNKRHRKKKVDGVVIKSKPNNMFTKMGVQAGKVEQENKAIKEAEAAAEEKKLAVLMIPKKRKRLYDKIMHGKRRKTTEANKLTAKRQKYDNQQKAALKKKKSQS